MHTKFIQFDPAPRRGGPNSKEVRPGLLRPSSFSLLQSPPSLDPSISLSVCLFKCSSHSLSLTTSLPFSCSLALSPGPRRDAARAGLAGPAAPAGLAWPEPLLCTPSSILLSVPYPFLYPTLCSLPLPLSHSLLSTPTSIPLSAPSPSPSPIAHGPFVWRRREARTARSRPAGHRATRAAAPRRCGARFDWSRAAAPA
jgi:hypothetical protein